MRVIAGLMLVLSPAATAAAAVPDERPPMPYYDWGACPFECCTYRWWKAEGPVAVYKRRSGKGALAFRLSKGEWVHAMTGVVVTYRYGVTRIVKPIELGYPLREGRPALRLQPGELVYTLHYTGEGNDLFWYKGRVYFDQIAADKPDPDPPPPDRSVQVLSRPRYAWWAKVRNTEGRVGWTMETHKFGNVDACG